MSFLDDLFSPIAEAGKSALGALSSAAPALGTIIGNSFGGPTGGAIGNVLGTAARNAFGGGQQQPQQQQQQQQQTTYPPVYYPPMTYTNPPSPISPETYSLAPTPSSNLIDDYGNPMSNFNPGNAGGFAGRQAGNAIGNAGRNLAGPRYGNMNFGQMAGQAGEDFGSMMSNLVPQQFRSAVQPSMQNFVRQGANYLSNRFMPQEWQNRDFNSFGDMGENYGSQFNDRINNVMSPQMQGNVKDAFLPGLAAARGTGGAPGTPPQSPYAAQNRINSPDQGDLSNFEGFGNSMPEGFKYGGHVTRGATDLASVMSNLGYVH